MATLTTLVCLFHHASEARAALADLRQAGVPESSIRLIGEGGTGADSLDRFQLASIGMPDYDYDHLKGGVKDGGLVLSVDASAEEIATVEAIFEEHSARFVDEAEKTGSATFADRSAKQGYAFQPGTIEFTETAETLVIAKQAQVVEEVVVSKEASQRIEPITETLRHTEVNVEDDLSPVHRL